MDRGRVDRAQSSGDRGLLRERGLSIADSGPKAQRDLRPMWLVLGACALMLAGGFALKSQCLAPWTDYHQYSSLCYNDIQPLWALRGVGARVFPYIHGDLVDGRLTDGAIEYPVLTGVFMWVSGASVRDENAYLIRSALLLAPFALLTSYFLADLTKLRALLWAAAPALVLYAFHNWDLLAVAATVAGFWLWWRGRSVATSVCFAIGGALKLFPLLFLLPLGIEQWASRGRRVSLRAVAVGVGAFALINLPFVLANFDGWWATFEFHALRGPNFDNIWAIRTLGPLELPALEPADLNRVTAILTGVMFIGAFAFGFRRMKQDGSYPFVQVSAALLAAFLLWNKVHSPQYALWLLPFFVLLRVNVGWWVAYTLVDLAVYIGVFRFFYDACSRNDCRIFAEPTFAQRLMNVGVFGRAGLLALLFLVFLAAQLASPRDVSHPPARLSKARRSAMESGTASE
jgi:uncharacterized membrane protein